jgi:hypothetical protein
MPDATTIKFDSRLKQGDYIKISLLLFFSGWRTYVVMGLFCVGLVLFIAGVTIVPLLFVLVITAIFVFMTIVKATSGKSRHFYLPRKLTFTEDSIRGKTRISDETLAWEDIFNIRRLSAYYLIYFSREKFLAVPERDIPSGKREQLEELFSTKAGSAGRA